MILSRSKNGRDDTRLIPPRQVSLKLNHYNKVRKQNISNLIKPPKPGSHVYKPLKYYN